VLFTGGQIGAAMPQEGVLRDPSEDLGEAVRLTLGHLEQVTLAAGRNKEEVFEVSAFPKISGRRGEIEAVVRDFLGFDPPLFNYHEVYDVAAHALLEMDWMAVAEEDLDPGRAAELLQPLGNGPEKTALESGPFVIWNQLSASGEDLGEASRVLLEEIQALLEERGGRLEDLVKLTVYLKEFDPYPLFNEATKRAFAEIIPPTRSVLVAPGVTGEAQIVVDVLALQAQ
jgi:enamine deaminase RidA (YjgF/YER057c/UK114 family)